VTKVGRQLATGRTADVFAYGNDSVVKVLRTSVPADHQGEEMIVVVRDEGETAIGRGDDVRIAFAGPIHVFADDGERVGD